jgi:hypothetical protein
MDKTHLPVLCYLRMTKVIRKNDKLPIHLDRERFEEIFWQLREHPEKVQSKRVAGCLELLSCLRADLSGSEKVRVITGLQHLLSAYRWVVQVSPTPGGFRAIHLIADRERLSEDDLWEHMAIRDLLAVVPYLGKRPRIRRCDECKEWFYAANREDQRWCGGNCRQHHYDSNPEMRAGKARYMCEYRIAEKESEESSKKGVGFVSGGRKARRTVVR